MGKKEGKGELEDVEAIPREQAEKEMHEAAKRVKREDSHHTSGKGKAEEEEEVTPASREQAREELHEAVERAKKEQKK